MTPSSHTPLGRQELLTLANPLLGLRAQRPADPTGTLRRWEEKGLLHAVRLPSGVGRWSG